MPTYVCSERSPDERSDIRVLPSRAWSTGRCTQATARRAPLGVPDTSHSRRAFGRDLPDFASLIGATRRLRSSEMTRWARTGLTQRMRGHSCQLLRFTASYASRLNSTANG
jgi:hypothetical protein